MVPRAREDTGIYSYPMDRSLLGGMAVLAMSTAQFHRPHACKFPEVPSRAIVREQPTRLPLRDSIRGGSQHCALRNMQMLRPMDTLTFGYNTTPPVTVF